MTPKYTLRAFNSPYNTWYIDVKRTNSFIVYFIYMILFFIKYDCVDIVKRK